MKEIEGFQSVFKNKYIMNKKTPDKVKDYPIMVRLTGEENRMAGELRNKFNINISSLVRNTIRKEYEEKCHE